MKSLLKTGVLACSLLYAGAIVAWCVLHSWRGDGAWWLAVLNTFAPFFFLPLLLLLPLCLLVRRRSLWLSAALPALIFVWLYGGLFLPARPAALAADEAPLTVMTFNVWAASRSPRTAQALVDGGLPDIVALQELSPDMARVLVEELGHVYPYHAADPRTLGNGLGVFSRYPLRELDASHLTSTWWRVQIVQVQVGARAVVVYNVHLPGWSFLLDGGTSLGNQIQAGVQARRDLARQLAQDIARQPGPVIVAGDLNSTDRGDAYALLAEELADAHRAAGWGLGATYPAEGHSYYGLPFVPTLVRIDMILYSQELMALRSSVGSTHGESDHLPVFAQLAWRK
jgi:endonuclease/exonuclease/phosphatase (EEP) superfamily protein YafD